IASAGSCLPGRGYAACGSGRRPRKSAAFLSGVCRSCGIGRGRSFGKRPSVVRPFLALLRRRWPVALAQALELVLEAVELLVGTVFEIDHSIARRLDAVNELV